MKTLSDQDWIIIREAAEKWRETTLHREEHKKLCDALDRVKEGHTPVYAWSAPTVSTQLRWNSVIVPSGSNTVIIGDPGDEI